MNFRLTIAVMSSLLLSSCAVFQEDFSCSTISGKPGCHALGEISKSVENGTFKSVDTAVATTTTQKSFGYSVTAPKAGDPVRFGDHIQKVTVFPYEDSEGYYHDISQIFMVVKQSHWVGKPVGRKNV